MIINPIIPIWLMAVICVILLFFTRKGAFNYIRQIIIIILLFAINLRIMVPNPDAETVEKKVDVLFVVDNTISMLAEDYGKDNGLRLDAVKNDCSYIMQQLPGAAFSVVSFGNSCKKMLPYTMDTGNVEQALKSLNGQSSMYATGTDLDTVLHLLKVELAGEKDHLQIVFFISDGENTKGDALSSFPELADYIDGGAVLGYGTEEGGPMAAYAFTGDDREPEYLYYYDDNFDKKNALSRIDQEKLKEIASDMAIEYIHMTDQNNVDEVLAGIREQIANADTEENEKGIHGYSDTYFYLLIPLLPLLVVDFIYYRRKVNF